MSVIPSPEDELIREHARRLDDPFRNSLKFGPNGQYRMCDLCGGTFESRGLRLCPDCYEIRKQQPGFDDDKSFVSTAGKVTFDHRICLWCGAPIERFRDGRKISGRVMFCSAPHQRAHARATPEERAARSARVRDLRAP